VHLDGLPLALELAAARIRLLPPQALLAHLSQRLQVLDFGPRTSPARQQTLRKTLQWSYDLLGHQEQGTPGASALPAARGLCRRLDAAGCRGAWPRGRYGQHRRFEHARLAPG
jgi:predicted ATPase